MELIHDYLGQQLRRENQGTINEYKINKHVSKTFVLPGIDIINSSDTLKIPPKSFHHDPFESKIFREIP